MYLDIDRNSVISIKKQLYNALTEKILNGELERGRKLPSSRQLSQNLNIARNTVIEIYEQLTAEAYLKTERGSGTYVAAVRQSPLSRKVQVQKTNRSSEESSDIISLIAGTPDLDSFPQKAWQNAYRDVLLGAQSSFYGYGNPHGYQPLQRSLARYLAVHKGINCSYEQIIITGGTKDALRLLALSLQDQFQNLMTEALCINFAPHIFRALGYQIIPVPVDAEGIVTEKLQEEIPSLIYTSPSHQFPLGGTLSIDRRQALLSFARQYGHIVIEDDYDSEFRYRGAPVNALFQLDTQNVIHVGTFSKTLCPSLRLGYAVLPENLMSVVKGYRYQVGNPPATLDQVALNELIVNGAYEKHIYTMNKIYKAKMTALTEGLEEAFGKAITINGSSSGLHISVDFADLLLKPQHRFVFFDHGVVINLINDYRHDGETEPSNTLVLGFGHLKLGEIPQAVTRLKSAIEQIRKNEGETNAIP